MQHALPVNRGFQVLNARQLRQPRNLDLYKYKKGKGVPCTHTALNSGPAGSSLYPSL